MDLSRVQHYQDIPLRDLQTLTATNPDPTALTWRTGVPWLVCAGSGVIFPEYLAAPLVGYSAAEEGPFLEEWVESNPEYVRAEEIGGRCGYCRKDRCVEHDADQWFTNRQMSIR